MLAARAARCFSLPLTTFVTTLGKSSITGVVPKQPLLTVRIQLYASESRNAVRRQVSRAKSLKERLLAPAGDSAFGVGRGFAIGASALGLGALVYYGFGLSNEAGAIDRSVMWSEEVKRRIHSTYMYFGGSLVVTAISAFAISRSPSLLNLMMRNSWLSVIATFAAMIGSGIIVRSIPYKEGFGAKKLAWLAHCGIMGGVIAPLCFLGGPLLIRAAWYTAGLAGGLSLLAACAPSEKFLYMGGPLALGLGLVMASSIGTFFLPPTTAVGAGLYSISIYGGLVLFGLFLLYDTQHIIRKAEYYPVFAQRPYDPINESIGIYLDTLNIFIRIALTLTGGGSSKRK